MEFQGGRVLFSYEPSGAARVAHGETLWPCACVARVLAAEEGHHGPLLPRHIHWAYQNLNCERKIPRRQPPKRLLR